MKYRKFVFLSAVVSAFAFSSGEALADNYCVGSVPACTASPAPPFTADTAGITAAIAAANAHSGEDSVFLAAGTYPLGGAFAPSFAAAQDIHIIGAGVGQTVFSGSIASAAQITFNFTTTASEAKDFSLNITGTPANAIGVQVFKGALRNFAVGQPGGNASGVSAVALDSGAVAERGSISMTSQSAVGFQLKKTVAAGDDGNGSASDITMTGGAGASMGILIDTNTPAGRSFERMRISNFGRGVEVTTGGFTLRNAVIDLRAINAGQGIDAFNGISSSDIAADVSRVTIVGTGPFQTALNLGATGTNTFEAGFSDMVLFVAGETSNGVVCTGGGLSVSATIDSFAIRGAEFNQSGCSPTKINKTDLNATDPGFRDFNRGDFRLKPNSPLVDHGMVGEIIDPAERDLSGASRVVDGDGNGTAIVDVGAFEYQRLAPTVSASSCLPAPRAGAPCRFSATGSDGDGDALSFTWSFDDGGTASGSSPEHVFAAAGKHTAAVTATDESGLTASATALVTVAPIPGARVLAKPKKAFVRAKKGFAAPRARQPFFSIAFTDAAKARFTLQVRRSGKLRTVRGSQTLALKSAKSKFGFGGRFGGKRLKAGRYRVTVTPLAADAFAGAPVALNFDLK